ncbi:MAG: hypothetical protein GY757_47095, partial [bacterium]|nr:hypothetical protein [bacterium]
TLLEDRGGNLWIGTNGGGLSCLNNGKLTTYSQKGDNSSSSKGFANDMGWALCEDHRHRLWIGTDEGLSCMEPDKFTTFTTKDGLTNNRIRALHEDRSGHLWIATEGGGLNRMINGKFIPFTGIETANGLVSLSGKSVRCIYEDREGCIWVGTGGGGLNCLTKDSLTVYTTADGLAGNRVRAIYEDRRESLWIGTYGGGLNRFRDGEFSTYATADGLVNNNVDRFYEDVEGSLWIGTEGGGLVRLKDGPFTTYSRVHGLSDDLVWCVFEDSKGNLWVGTDGGGLNLLQKGKTTVYTTKEGLSGNIIKCIFEDSEGSIWIGTDGSGLNRLKNGSFTTYSTADGLANDLVRCIAEDNRGNLWIGTEGGLNRFKNGSFTSYTTEHGLSNSQVWCILYDKNAGGQLWLGTHGGGLNLLKNGTFTAFTTNNGLANNSVRCIYKDPGGTLWIATGGGLNRLRENKLFSFSAKDGLFDDNIYWVLEDDKKNLWMSCNKGVFTVSKNRLELFASGMVNSFKSISYDEKDGMKSRECNGGTQPAGCKSRDGKLRFPTINGIAMIDPANSKINLHPPAVAIEEFIVNNKKIQEYVSPGKKIILPPGMGRLEIHYTGLSFLVPDKVRFKYKLEGFDDDWIKVGDRRTAYYTKVPPGNYRFRVTACNNDGIWNTTGAEFSFLLTPRFYQTFWFFAFVILFVILTGSLGYTLKIRNLKARTGKLHLLIEEKTKDLKERNEELETIERTIKVINREMEMEQLLESMLKKAMELFPRAEKGVFLMYDNNAQRFKAAAYKGYDEALAKKVALTYKEAVSRYSEGSEQLEKGVYIVRQFKNIAGEEALQFFPTAKVSLVMKGIVEGKVEGMLVLDNMSDKRAFDHSDVQKLRRFREHAVSAISKVRAMEQMESRIEQRTTELTEANKMLRDEIIERLRQEEEITLAKESAEMANRAKSQFLANISHEIRTPMNAILGFSNILEQELTDPQYKGYLESISNNTKTLLALINDILDLSRIESGKMELHYEALNLRSILDEIKNIFSEKAKDKKLDFILDVAADLPGSLLLDRLRIRQVLFNLVGNAVKFTEEGFVKISAHKGDSIGGTPGTLELILMVQDSGIGIPGDQLSIIFENFSQRDEPRSEVYGGAGMGLSITQRLTRLMQGKISVKSTVGKGSIFRVALSNVSVSNETELEDSSPKTDAAQEDREPTESPVEPEDKPLTTEIISKIPELVSLLRGKPSTRWEKIKKTYILDEIEGFAHDIITLGVQYQVKILENWGKKLFSEIEAFDMQAVPKTLEYFPELLEKMAAIETAFEEKNSRLKSDEKQLQNRYKKIPKDKNIHLALQILDQGL